MEDRPKIAIEDLLKLKRHEKPQPDFWNEFDRGLHRKSLEALKHKPRGFFAGLWEFKPVQYASALGAFVICSVPAYIGVQSFTAERESLVPSRTNPEQPAVLAASEPSAPSVDFALIERNTRELESRKRASTQVDFVVDSYQIESPVKRGSSDQWISRAGAQLRTNRTYVADMVNVVPRDAVVLPVSLSY